MHKHFMHIFIISIILQVESVNLFANEQNLEYNIPVSATDHQLVRQKFPVSVSNPVLYSIYKEEDFYKVNYNSDVRLVIMSDITLTKTITINSKHDLIIDGNGHTIRDGGISLKKVDQKNRQTRFSFPDTLSGKESFVATNGKYISLVHTNVYQAKSWSYDEKSGLCSMVLPKELSNLSITANDSVLIAYELWFVRQIDKVESVKDGVLTFHCRQNYKPISSVQTTWTPRPMIYLINYCNKKNKTDVSVHGGIVYINGSQDSLYKCSVDNLLCIGKGTVVQIEDLKLTGGNKASIQNHGTLKCENCEFYDDKAIAIKSSKELFINNCSFHNIEGSSISAGNRSYVDITNSSFKRCGLTGSNDACIKGASNIYVGNNVFTDFNYSAICVGRVNTLNEADLCSVTIESNTLHWTSFWTKQIKKYGLSDSGAIYVGTNNRRVIIRNNTITNFGGHGFNRAIFCDDGAYNLTIYGNTIIGTANSYDIDSRDCTKINARKVPQGYYINTNNYICHNHCTGKVRLMPSSIIKDNQCLFEDNDITTK